jgi:hypothetical protein
MNSLDPGFVYVPYVLCDTVEVIYDSYERIKNEVLLENRDRAIDSILDNKEYIPMKIEEHPDYDSFVPSKSIKSRYSVMNINQSYYQPLK